MPHYACQVQTAVTRFGMQTFPQKGKNSKLSRNDIKKHFTSPFQKFSSAQVACKSMKKNILNCILVCSAYSSVHIEFKTLHLEIFCFSDVVGVIDMIPFTF